MKKIILIPIIIIISFSSLFLTGCKEEGTSIQDRIESFVSDLNDSNRSGIFKDHFHSDSTSYSNGDSGTIESKFPADEAPFSLGSISGSGSTRTVIINSSGDASSDGSYTFTMKEEDTDDWYIRSLTGPLGTLD